MLKLVANNTTKDVEDYKTGEQVVRFQCTECLAKVMMKISEIDSHDPVCGHCKKRR